ncbi:hypothetical protein CK203_082623 [Vitis vinifera]|uniref:Uncharacterized protein n=1 Tax=Vitis vinifera TaxID=29760 RepID=A0A438BWK0_VITVI|nr:hypothetical protein CK203_082623 [Vitis vinifera]
MVFVEKKTFLVRLEGEHGGNWCSITEHSRGSAFVLVEKGRQYKGERFIHNHVGPLHRSFANVVNGKGPRGSGLVPVERWAEPWCVNTMLIALNGLSKVTVRIAMKDRLVLPALIEVTDGGWVFTISVVVVGVEDVQRGSVMGESTREAFASHSGDRWRKAGGRESDQRLGKMSCRGRWPE